MGDKFTKEFIEALKKEDIKALRSIPKSDLHNHFVLGGNREYIKKVTGIDIPSFKGTISSMDKMDKWSSTFIGERFDTIEGRRLLIDATFMQADMDGVKVIEVGEDVWGLGEFFHNDIEELIAAFQESRGKYAPEAELRLQIGLSRHCPIDYLMDCLKPFWGRDEFYSIDLYGDELCQPIENFKPIYEKARDNGLRLKAHVGEWGKAEDIRTAIEVLKLDEVQHGISAVNSQQVLDYLIEKNIRLNITPTSNVILERVPSMKKHPIKTLYRAGVDVTINSDDILMFDSDVSKEYLRLYKAEVLSPEELDNIRISGLKHI